MSGATLNVYKPDVLVSISVPFSTETYCEVNLKKTFRSLIKRHEAEERQKENEQESSNGNPGGPSLLGLSSAPPPPLPVAKPARRNPYDNIIEQLERKYRGQVVRNLQEDSENSRDSAKSPGSADDFEDDSGDDPESSKGTRKKKKGGYGNWNDTYDLDDEFIDDTETFEQVTSELRTKKLKTKHDGFFVSSGKLEVVKSSPGKDSVGSVEDTVKLKKVLKRKKKKEGKENKEGKDGAMKSSPKKKKKMLASMGAAGSAASKATLPQAHSGGKSADTGSITKDSARDVDEAGNEDDDTSTVAMLTSDTPAIASASKPKAAPKPKPTWYPTDATTKLLEQFQEHVKASGVKVKKTFLPRELEAELYAVDCSVKKEEGARIKVTSGYLERLTGLLGGEIAAGKIGRILKRLDFEGKAKEYKIAYQEAFEKLIQSIKLAICEKPPPGPNTGAAPVAATETLEKAEGAGSNEDHLSATPSADPSEASSPHAPDGSQTAAAPLVVYKHTCTWPLAMKSLLGEAAYLLDQWIDTENSSRELLTNYDKQFREDEDCEYLNSKTHIKNFFDSLSQKFPESCEFGDIAYLRKKTTLEKAKVKRKYEKMAEKEAEREAKELAAAKKEVRANAGEDSMDGTPIKSESASVEKPKKKRKNKDDPEGAAGECKSSKKRKLLVKLAEASSADGAKEFLVKGLKSSTDRPSSAAKSGDKSTTPGSDGEGQSPRNVEKTTKHNGRGICKGDKVDKRSKEYRMMVGRTGRSSISPGGAESLNEEKESKVKNLTKEQRLQMGLVSKKKEKGEKKEKKEKKMKKVKGEEVDGRTKEDKTLLPTSFTSTNSSKSYQAETTDTLDEDLDDALNDALNDALDETAADAAANAVDLISDSSVGTIEVAE
jgi:hypothetical protein